MESHRFFKKRLRDIEIEKIKSRRESRTRLMTMSIFVFGTFITLIQFFSSQSANQTRKFKETLFIKRFESLELLSESVTDLVTSIEFREDSVDFYEYVRKFRKAQYNSQLVLYGTGDSIIYYSDDLSTLLQEILPDYFDNTKREPFLNPEEYGRIQELVDAISRCSNKFILDEENKLFSSDAWFKFW